jgi:UDP-3-O-[3-hydroxymyristoyl] glucosamine N-acyltransferase
MSGVKDSVPANASWGGFFAKPTKQWFREIITVERLVRDGVPKSATGSTANDEDPG